MAGVLNPASAIQLSASVGKKEVDSTKLNMSARGVVRVGHGVRSPLTSWNKYFM